MGKEGAVGDQALGAARAAGLLGSPGSPQPQLSWHEGAGEEDCGVLEDIVSGTTQGFIAVLDLH